jgi:hypothetical protein
MHFVMKSGESYAYFCNHGKKQRAHFFEEQVQGRHSIHQMADIIAFGAIDCLDKTIMYR